MKRKTIFIILSILLLSSCDSYKKEENNYNNKTTKDLIKNLDKHPEYFSNKDQEEIIDIINENGKIFKEQKRR